MNRKYLLSAAVVCLAVVVAGGAFLAREHFQKEKAEEYFEEALRAGRAGNADRAMAHLYAALEIHPRFSRAYSLLGWYHFQRENWARAEELLHQAVRCDPYSKQDWFLLAELYYRQGRLRAFLTALATALRIDPRYPKPYLQRALMHYDLNLYELALEDVSRVLELDPGNGAALELRELIIAKASGEEEDRQKEMKYFRIPE